MHEEMAILKTFFTYNLFNIFKKCEKILIRHTKHGQLIHNLTAKSEKLLSHQVDNKFDKKLNKPIK